MSLSDKRFDGFQCSCCDKKLRNKFFSYREEDVKEFIKDLKKLKFAITHEEIDKLAGKELANG